MSEFIFPIHEKAQGSRPWRLEALTVTSFNVVSPQGERIPFHMPELPFNHMLWIRIVREEAEAKGIPPKPALKLGSRLAQWEEARVWLQSIFLDCFCPYTARSGQSQVIEFKGARKDVWDAMLTSVLQTHQSTWGCAVGNNLGANPFTPLVFKLMLQTLVLRLHTGTLVRWMPDGRLEDLEGNDHRYFYDFTVAKLTAEECVAWAEHLSDYQVIQVLPQLAGPPKGLAWGATEAARRSYDEVQSGVLV